MTRPRSKPKTLKPPPPPISFDDHPEGPWAFSVTVHNWQPVPLNVLMKSHHMKAARMKAADRQVIALAFRHGPKAAGKRRVLVHFTLAKGQRAIDPGAEQKSLGDALTHAKMLTDDNRQGVEWAPATYERGGHAATRVTLEDLT